MIAIIGKSGVGKSTFLHFLEKQGYKILIVDDLVKKLYQNGNEGYKLIQNHLGSDFVNETEVDKKALVDRIFLQPEFINKIELLIFPLIEKHLENNFYDFVEIPILYKKNGNFRRFFSKVICIDIPEKRRVKNLQIRNVNNKNKIIIDTLNKYFLDDKIVNIYCYKVLSRNFFKKFFKIYFS
ncbi:dephospho-CoA kinase [Mycoplasma miroungirhinis]|uniref:Dephospho-CoA kinase n=1 Tax=Mycoplasma miroungirhinis TaxID=754516 RepID=A0A6M4JDC0_9MOLU|nr:dephospho-CoA kinase [Mycoplasma miroungirhinis]QJR44077.1 dephospho-CoA kinase [Mycoplasma miroungirhinis]